MDDAIRRGVGDPEIEENFKEVVNVLAAVAPAVIEQRAVLESMTRDDSVLEVRTARQMSAAGGHWTLLEVAVEGYPSGHMAVSYARTPTEGGVSGTT